MYWASTEPPFITADNDATSTIYYRARSRFNGAAVHHGG